jgi:hypothetical protein
LMVALEEYRHTRRDGRDPFQSRKRLDTHSSM